MPAIRSLPSYLAVDAARKLRRTALARTIFCLLASPLVGCSLTSPESSRTINVDSLTVSPSTEPGSFLVRAHGMRGLGGCERSLEVVRIERIDSLVRRFVVSLDERRDVACPLAPFPLDSKRSSRSQRIALCITSCSNRMVAHSFAPSGRRKFGAAATPPPAVRSKGPTPLSVS